MILVDTAPLIALIDRRQEAHNRCSQTYRSLSEPMLTSWCCLTEAMYFLHQLRGWQGQEILWQFIERKALQIHHSSIKEQRRMAELMAQYQDLPMDLADASLVAAAEALNMKRIFTLDSDFYIYRLNGQEGFEVIP